MKKFIIILITFLILPTSTLAQEKIQVKLSSCVDGDTAKFIMDKEVITVRFLAIDTPETNHPEKGEEPYGKEAKDFTCKSLKNAKKIELEFDDNAKNKDKYDRYLAWVFYDDYLLQSQLIKNGLAEVAYLYDDYKYTPLLQDTENQAKLNKVGMYSDTDNSYYTTSKNAKKNIVDKLIGSIYDFVLKFLEEII